MRVREWVSIALALLVIAGSTPADASTTRAKSTATRTYPVTIRDAGIFAADYSGEGAQFHTNFTWDESRSFTIKLKSDAVPAIVRGPLQLKASGTSTSSGFQPAELNTNCTFAAAGSPDPDLVNVESVTVTGKSALLALHAQPPTGTTHVSTGAPLTTSGACSTGISGNGSVDGVSPYLHYHPSSLNRGADVPALTTNSLGQLTGLDLDQLARKAVVEVSFPVDYTETDAFGGSEKVVIADKLTVSIKKACSSCACAAGSSSGGSASKDACVDIYVNNSKSTDTKADLVVGQPVELQVYIDGKLATKSDNPVWDVPKDWYSGKKAAMTAGYTADQRSPGARVLPFDAAKLKQSTVDSYFMTGDPAGKEYPIRVDTKEGPATTTLRLYVPEITNPPGFTACRVDIVRNTMVVPSGATIEPPALSLGLNDSCPNVIKDRGVSWDLQVNSPRAGELGMNQLITRSVTLDGKTCAGSWPGKKADEVSLFNVINAKEGTTRFATSDSPNVGLNPEVTKGFFPVVAVDFSAWDSLMYRSSEPRSIWVPFWSLFWRWTGVAKYDGAAAWRLDQGALDGPRLQSIREWPQWQEVGHAGDTRKC